MENPAGHPKPPPNTDRELVVWLREQLDADAEAERRTSGGTWDYDPADRWITNEDSHVLAISDGAPVDIAHVTRYSPAAVLADIAAKRAIVDEVMSWSHAGYRGACPQADPDLFPDIPCDCDLGDRRMRILGPLALAYSHRPGYREEWRPT